MADTAMGDLVSAASALESFHITTPISFPEDFVIKVVDPTLKRVIEVAETERTMALPCRKISAVVRNWLAELVDAAPATPAVEKAKEGELLVVVEAVEGAQLHDDDTGVSGVYVVYGIDPAMTDMEKAESALETFHTSNGIKVLDDFEISVIDPVTRKIMDTGEECEFGEFQCDKLSEDIPDWINNLLNPTASTPESKPAAPRREEDDLSPGF
jgi:hypothetical protein